MLKEFITGGDNYIMTSVAPDSCRNPRAIIHSRSLVSGVLVLDKPEDMTSFSVVSRVRNCLGQKKVGHCGTLDPFATGVLVICLNGATRISDQLSLQDKLYRFSIHFGLQTDTLDRTGQTVHSYHGPAISEEELLSAIGGYVGPYRQNVPRYAAVKVQGRRLYELARKGIEVELPSREVCVHRLELIRYTWPEAVMEVHCSKGTYVRQLAADIGGELGCGAHVTALRRLASGSFDIGKSISLEELQRVSKTSDAWQTRVISLSAALAHLPALVIEDQQILSGLANGHLDSEWQSGSRRNLPGNNNPVRLLAGSGHLLALWWPECKDDSNPKGRLRVFRSSA
jgi:tRNA pseudouridine55 synthase